MLREFNELVEPSVSWQENEETLNKHTDDGFVIKIELPYYPNASLLFFASNELLQEQNAHITIAKILVRELTAHF